MTTRAYLHDERSQPPLRTVLGSLLARATHADLAVAHVRLLAIDLEAAALPRLARCRMLLARLDGSSLASAPARLRAGRLDRLRAFLASGVVEVRSPAASMWTPDFSVFHGLPRRPPFADGSACLIGAHYFGEPGTGGSAAFTCLLTGNAVVERAAARFEEEWLRAYDVGVVVAATIDEMRGALTAGAAAPGG
jgi:hypothetical protein